MTTYINQFYIQSENNIYLQNTTSDGSTEDMLIARGDGAVELYYDNSKKFETTSIGVEATGHIFTTTKFRGNDDVKVSLGTSEDLQIYHTGSANWIDSVNNHEMIIRAGTGDLYLQGGNIYLGDEGAAEKYIDCHKDGAVELFHDNVKKFETTSAGCSATTGIDFPDNQGARFGAGGDLKIYHDGSTNIISGLDGLISIRPKTGENGVLLRNNSSVDLFYDDAKKFETSSTGVAITGNAVATGNSAKFETVESGGATVRMASGGLTGYLGTYSNDPMKFIANSSEFMKLTNEGWLKMEGNGGYIASTQNYHECNSNNAGNVTLRMEHTNADGYGILIVLDNDNASKYFFRGIGDANDRAYIRADGDMENANNRYGSISDVKLKENIVDANSQWADIKALKIRNFNFKSDSSKKKMLGVVAQEAETISPGIVTTHPDLDSDNKDLGTETKVVAYSVLYMKAIKALQEAMTKIETLETKVAALEAG